MSRIKKGDLSRLAAEARARGESRFFTGVPCRNGHVAERYANKFAGCVICATENQKLQRSLRPGYAKYGKAFHERHRERRLQRQRELREINRERDREFQRKWAQEHAAHLAEKRARRRCQLANACPPWVDRGALYAIYKEARRLSKETGIPHEVDHIYPIKHPDFCGLHVSWNLRIVPRCTNRSKGNKHPKEVLSGSEIN